MLETLSTCPICASTQFTKHQECKDHLVSGETFNIVRCESCGFLLTNPRPTQNSIISYYKSDSYVSHTNKSNSPINLIYRLVRHYTLRQKLNILKQYALEGRLLDFGCGTGHFLSFAKSKGWQTSGIEPDDQARMHANILTDNQAFKNIDELPQVQFNAITMFHVLEHVHQLADTLGQLAHKLAQNGIFIVAVPNHLSHDAKHYQSDWAAYDLPRHLYHFDPNSIALLSEKVGLKVVAQLPMRFDSYYVSLLSEKYRNNFLYPIFGFYRGLVSNLNARKNKQYSSLIYVLQKK